MNELIIYFGQKKAKEKRKNEKKNIILKKKSKDIMYLWTKLAVKTHLHIHPFRYPKAQTKTPTILLWPPTDWFSKNYFILDKIIKQKNTKIRFFIFFFYIINI